MLPEGSSPAQSLYFSVNAGKRSLTLDLKHEAARPVIERLVERADVLVENFKAGTLDRMGLGYEAVRRLNPSLVYCSISGYGQTGPRSGAPAYDPMIQAVSGMMSVNGYEETGPTKVGFWICDMSTGIAAAFAIVAALYRRTLTGDGERLDVSMLDAAVGLLSPLVSLHLNGGQTPILPGNGVQGATSVSTVYPTRSGHLLVATATQAQFRTVCRIIGRPELADDPRFSVVRTRIANAAAWRQLLVAAFADADAQEWERRLGEAGIPASAVQTIPEMARDPQVAHRGLVAELPPPDGADRPVSIVGAAFTRTGGRAMPASPPPALGQHTEEILTELGFAAREIGALRAAGAV
jgi:crotonobetainyl-CoA:carnitine CoA-transferase CaiB-like acyl-CoA transferase